MQLLTGASKRVIKPRKAVSKPKAPHVSYKYGRAIRRIVIHCTATSQNATVKAIQNYWFNNKKWSRNGYHIMISPDGTINKLEPFNKISNGVRGYNADSINISYIGGKSSDDRTYMQRKVMKEVVQALLAELGPVEVVGHRDLAFIDKNGNGKAEPNEWLKRCPSFDVYSWLIEENLK